MTKKSNVIKKILLIPIFFFSLILSYSAFSGVNGGAFGAGIILGSPTALSGKYWMDGHAAIDIGLAFAMRDYVLFYGDYLFHYPWALGGRDRFVSQLSPYLGIGGILASTTTDRGFYDRYFGNRSGSIGLGVRVPLGIEWKSMRPSIGVFLELVPGIIVIPGTGFLFQGGFGIRYYF